MKIKLDPPLYAWEISEVLGVPFLGSCSRAFSHLATSSEECDTDTLFVALAGTRRHGDEFIPSLSRFGVASIGGVRCKNTFFVPSGLSALMRLAAARRASLKTLRSTVGITGSVGKTTTKDATALVLSQKYKVFKTPNNLNSEIGLSLSILSAPLDTEVLVLELGINHVGEMARLRDLARPNIAVITGIGRSHIGNFPSVEALAAEKAKIVAENTDTLLVRADHPYPISFENVRRVGEGGLYQLLPLDAEGWMLFHPGGTLPLRLSAMERDIESALLFALSVGALLGLDDAELIRGATEASRLEGRRCTEAIGNVKVIDDSYNASLESVDLALCVLCRGRGGRYAVLSDILELGTHAEEIHEEVGALIAKHAPDGVFFLGDHGKSVQIGAARGGYDTERIVALRGGEHEHCALLLTRILKEGDSLLLKGSHGGALWRVKEHLRALLQKETNEKEGQI